MDARRRPPSAKGPARGIEQHAKGLVSREDAQLSSVHKGMIKHGYGYAFGDKIAMNYDIFQCCMQNARSSEKTFATWASPSSFVQPLAVEADTRLAAGQACCGCCRQSTNSIAYI